MHCLSCLSVHLPVGPRGTVIVRACAIHWCVWFSSCRSGLVSVLDSLFFSLSSFLPSVFLCLGTSQALSVCVYSFIPESYSVKTRLTELHTPSKLGSAWWDVLPEKKKKTKTPHSRSCCCPSRQLITKGEPSSFRIFFVRGGFQVMSEKILCASWQMQEWSEKW